MILQTKLLNKINNYIEKLYKNKEIKNLHLCNWKAYQASTGSIYIKVWSFLGEEKYTMTYRLSDHYKKSVKTKIVEKTTKFSSIERKIKNLFVSILRARLKNTLNQIGKKNVNSL